jgi:hypothetical protein
MALNAAGPLTRLRHRVHLPSSPGARSAASWSQVGWTAPAATTTSRWSPMATDLVLADVRQLLGPTSHRPRATPRGVLSGAHDGDDVRVQRQPPTCRWTLGRRFRPCVAAAAPAATSPRSGAKLRICAALVTFPGRPTEPAAAQSLRSAAQPCSRGDRMKALVPHATLHDDWNEALRDDPRPSLTGSCNCRSATAAPGPRRLLR